MVLFECLDHSPHSPAGGTLLIWPALPGEAEQSQVSPNFTGACLQTLRRDGKFTGLGTASLDAEEDAGNLAFCTQKP